MLTLHRNGAVGCIDWLDAIIAEGAFKQPSLMREELCDDSVSDRSAVNVAPFQLSEKLRCIHSITHFSAIILSLPWRKQTRATMPPREDSDHPCATRPAY